MSYTVLQYKVSTHSFNLGYCNSHVKWLHWYADNRLITQFCSFITVTYIASSKFPQFFHTFHPHQCTLFGTLHNSHNRTFYSKFMTWHSAVFSFISLKLLSPHSHCHTFFDHPLSCRKWVLFGPTKYRKSRNRRNCRRSHTSPCWEMSS